MKRWPFGLIGLAILSGLFALTAWTDDPANDTPPIMAVAMMAFGFVLLGCYLLARWGTWLIARRQKEKPLRAHDLAKFHR